MAVAEEDLLEDGFDLSTEILGDELDEEAEAFAELDVVLDESSQAFIDSLIGKIVLFMHELVGHELYPYQRVFAERVIESLLINDGEEITALFSRQSGKTETIADVVAALMILLPRLALMFPDLLGKYRRGFWVGCFAPIEDQVENLFSRIVGRLTSDQATDILLDPEIDDLAEGKGKLLRLKKSGSYVRMQTANPRAKIEGRTYHLIIVDEAQDADEFVVRKSIHPMGAATNATVVKTGTPTTHKGDFYKAIQLNKRRQTRRGARQNHFEADWKLVSKFNENYGKYVRREMLRLGEDSDEFQLAYALKWLLERGMFVTTALMEELGDVSMPIVRQYWKSPVVVGIDPARKLDSTVVTVVWVDWDNPDEFGYYDHRILNWLELHGGEWESQYFEIVNFLANYDVLAVGVDSQGVGDAVADRLDKLLRADVFELSSDRGAQSERWKHLMALMERRMIGWPAHAKTRQLRTWKRFNQQMIDLEKHYEGPYMLAEAPEEAEAHDDYPDSLALACALTKDVTMPEVQVTESPFYSHRSR